MNPLGVARRARGLSLADVSTVTRLSPRHVKAIDEGRFAELPVGIYARSYVRAFAGAVGLDKAELEQVLPLLPAAADPLPALKEEGARRPSSGRVVAVRVCAAASVDALLLLLVNAAAVGLVAAACGVGGGTLLTRSPVPLAVLCATTWALYFILLAGVRGRTAGQIVCGLPDRRAEAPLSLGAILQRAAGAWDARQY